MRKRIIITIVIVIIILIFILFLKNDYKLFKFGNNINSKSADNTKKYILDINSYEATVSIKINSNKNSNEYVAKEKYVKENNSFKQELLEPENIKGISFLYDGTNLKIENSNISVNKMYKNYPYIGENSISLIGFINDYQESNESNTSENEKEIIMETKIKNGNKYIAYKKLYINKENRKPEKMEIRDVTQNIVIYILYNEIKINNLQKEDVLAFELKQIINDI